MAKKKNTTIQVQPPRKLKPPKYRSFRLHKRIKPPVMSKIPSTFRLLVETKNQLMANKRLFGGILIVYGVLTMFFIWAGGNLLDVGELKNSINDALGTGNTVLANLTLFSVLLGNTANSTGDLSNTYQSLIFVITGLALVWAFRQTSDPAKKRLTIREAFYRGSAPLVPFFLVTLVVALQTLPMLVASFLYTTVKTNGLAATPIEQALWLLLFLVSALLTLYMLSSSLFALYIVTLPNMTPLKALRSARNVVAHRRLLVMRKIFVGLVMIFVVFAAVVLLAIFTITRFAELVFFVGTLISIPFGIGFIYKLYRSLL